VAKGLVGERASTCALIPDDGFRSAKGCPVINRDTLPHRLRYPGLNTTVNWSIYSCAKGTKMCKRFHVFRSQGATKHLNYAGGFVSAYFCSVAFKTIVNGAMWSGWTYRLTRKLFPSLETS